MFVAEMVSFNFGKGFIVVTKTYQFMVRRADRNPGESSHTAEGRREDGEDDPVHLRGSA